MKIIILLFIVLLSTQAFGATEKPPAIALEWWLREQGKFERATICTKEVEGKFEITEWKVDGISQPTDDKVNEIIKDYEKAKRQEKVNQQEKKEEFKQKFNLSEQDWQNLKTALSD